MTTHFITTEIALDESTTPDTLPIAIAAELQQQGEPLRWAVTSVTDGKAQIEAVVTVEATVEA